MTPELSKVFVLWHMYGDGSSAHIVRAYLDGTRARQDHELLTSQPSGSEWKLHEVDLYGTFL